MPKRITIYFSDKERLPEILQKLAEKTNLAISDIAKYLMLKGLENVKDKESKIMG